MARDLRIRLNYILHFLKHIKILLFSIFLECGYVLHDNIITPLKITYRMTYSMTHILQRVPVHKL